MSTKSVLDGVPAPTPCSDVESPRCPARRQACSAFVSSSHARGRQQSAASTCSKRTLKRVGFTVNHVVPYVGHKKQVCIMTLRNKARTSERGVFWQRLHEFERSLRPPFVAEDFWKVTLRHGLSPTLPRDGWFQCSSQSPFPRARPPLPTAFRFWISASYIRGEDDGWLTSTSGRRKREGPSLPAPLATTETRQTQGRPEGANDGSCCPRSAKDPERQSWVSSPSARLVAVSIIGSIGT